MFMRLATAQGLVIVGVVPDHANAAKLSTQAGCESFSTVVANARGGAQRLRFVGMLLRMPASCKFQRLGVRFWVSCGSN